MESDTYYRRRAAEIRADAEKIRGQQIKKEFLAIAKQYEELANGDDKDVAHKKKSGH